MKTNLIPVSDLPKVTLWLETLSLKEIAEKQSLNVCHVKRFIAEHNISALKVKQEYRKRVVRLNPNASMGELVKLLKCSYITVRRAIEDVIEDEGIKIPCEDLPNIAELLETLTIDEIAEKWDVTVNEMFNFMKANNLSAIDIKFDYRVKAIKENSMMNNFELSILIGCSESTVRNTKLKMNKKGIDYVEGYQNEMPNKRRYLRAEEYI